MAVTDTLVLYPVPGRGHIVSMLEFGKLIHKHHPEFSITVVMTTQKTADNFPDAYPFINFHYLLSTAEAAGSGSAAFSLNRSNNQRLHTALSDLSESTNLRALILDFFNTSAFEVGTALNIPTFYYFTSGANGLATFLHLPTLSRTFPQSFKDLGRQVLKIPGLPPITASDVPGRMMDRNSTSYQVPFSNIHKCRLLICIWLDLL